MDNLYIKDTLTKGRGVFASRDFKQGEIVEASPVVIFFYKNTICESQQRMYEDGENILVRTIEKTKELPKEVSEITFKWESANYNNGESCIALGYGSLFNGANPANLQYSIDQQNKKMLFIAVRDIKKDEELTINYSGVYGSHISSNNWWFDSRGIKYEQ